MAEQAVLYIVGSGRTGSTILGQVLNAEPGVFFGGELIDFWQRGVGENRLCSCGRRARDCEVWGTVIDNVSRDLTPAELEEMVSLRAEASLLERVSRSLSPWSLPQRSAFARRIEASSALLYRAIQRATGCRLIVDSSKFTYYALALKQIHSIDLTLLHLVRDPRAVAHSWRRLKTIPDPDGDLTMPRFGPMGSTFRWLARNLSASTLGARLPVGYCQLRYEDFMRDPDSALARVSLELGLSDLGVDLAHRAGQPLPLNHAIWGNPGRFDNGIVRLQEDDAWRREQARIDRWLVWAMTAPWLPRYGYR